MKKFFNAAAVLAPLAITTPLALSQDFSTAASIGIGIGSQVGAMLLGAIGLVVGANLSGNYESKPAKAATFGGFAFACEYDVERKWRETRLFRTAPVSANMILNFVGQHVLGMPRSY